MQQSKEPTCMIRKLEKTDHKLRLTPNQRKGQEQQVDRRGHNSLSQT